MPRNQLSRLLTVEELELRFNAPDTRPSSLPFMSWLLPGGGALIESSQRGQSLIDSSAQRFQLVRQLIDSERLTVAVAESNAAAGTGVKLAVVIGARLVDRGRRRARRGLSPHGNNACGRD